MGDSIRFLRMATFWACRMKHAISDKGCAFARDKLRASILDYKEAKVIEVFC